jgi:hypothetical protein
MSAPEILQQLVKRFEEHRTSYLSGKYNEAQLRQEFLNPFFEALTVLDNERIMNYVPAEEIPPYTTIMMQLQSK